MATDGGARAKVFKVEAVGQGPIRPATFARAPACRQAAWGSALMHKTQQRNP